MDGRTERRGKSYRAIVYEGSVVVDGKRKPIRSKATFKTKTEAQQYVHNRLDELEKPTRQSQRVGEYLGI